MSAITINRTQPVGNEPRTSRTRVLEHQLHRLCLLDVAVADESRPGRQRGLKIYLAGVVVAELLLDEYDKQRLATFMRARIFNFMVECNKMQITIKCTKIGK